MAIRVEDLRTVGLIDQDMNHPHLTNKGREWLRSLEELETQEVADSMDTTMDLILSSHGLLR